MPSPVQWKIEEALYKNTRLNCRDQGPCNCRTVCTEYIKGAKLGARANKPEPLSFPDRRDHF